MKIVSQKKGILIFLAFDLVLLAVFVLALLPLARSKNAPPSEQIALLNPKYRDSVLSITISRQEDERDLFHRHVITLVKSGGVWCGGDSLAGDLVWPADSRTIENLIDLAATVTTMYKKSDNVASWKEFSLNDEEATCLTFYGQGDQVLSKVFFGTEDSLTQRIAMRSSARGTVWDCPSSISTYLTLNQSFWADPYIFPLVASGLSYAESSSQLRRGQLLSSLAQGQPVATARKDFGNGCGVRLSLFAEQDGAYPVSATLVAGPALTDAERKAFQTVQYAYTISGWTYASLLEELGDAVH